MKTLALNIKQHRTLLENLISTKQGNLLDSEIIAVSQDLDILITEYYRSSSR